MNLPGSQNYDPSMPWVMFLRKEKLATRKANYVNDIHLCIQERDRSLEACRACAQLTSGMNFWGNQADNRKYRLPTVTPGAWNGVIVHTNTPFPVISMTDKKWTCFKAGILWILLERGATRSLLTLELRKIASLGVGVNVMQVYLDAKCYLKRIFNTLKAFRADRDSLRWRTDMSVASTKL